MAAARSTSSPRNPTVDANPDLARKKQRICEDDAATASPDGPVLIEISEPEDVGTNFANAIEIEDDMSPPEMELYSDAFILLSPGSQGSAFDALARAQHDIHQNLYMDPHFFQGFAEAIVQHVANTVDGIHEWRSHYFEQEADFFTLVASLSNTLLDSSDLFEPKEYPNLTTAKDLFHGLMEGLFTLCLRILPLLPDAIKSTVSRRDSAQGAIKIQTLGLLKYIGLARRLMSLDATLLNHFKHKYGAARIFDQAVLHVHAVFCSHNMLVPLTTNIWALTGAVREIKDSWPTLHQALQLFNIAIEVSRASSFYPNDQVEIIIGIANATILPAICAKHPRALPEHFHAELVGIIALAIRYHVEFNDRHSACSLYQRFVKGESDAMIPQADEAHDVETALWRICGQDRAVLADLLHVSWQLQTLKTFVRSEIMDIRNVGITLLKNKLVTIYNEKRLTQSQYDHPVIQYAVRFLRQNEITSYIFGPESRAGLVSHSADIICFLAATSTYTDSETDIIWQACFTSVEADFVKASFVVLESLLQFLDFHHLVYIARKYCDTPIERLGADAVGFLDRLFVRLQDRSLMSNEQAAESTLVSIAMDILKSANMAPPCPARDDLRRLTMAEISRLAQPGVDLEGKMETYKQCIPEIQRHSVHATTSIEILNIFLSARMHTTEASYVHAMLPVSAAIDELCSFVQNQQQDTPSQTCIFDIIVRFECIMRLMSLESFQFSEADDGRLFDHVFGSSALGNDARNQAWIRLYDLTQAAGGVAASTDAEQRYLEKYVPVLEARFATPKLIEFIGGRLKARFATEEVKTKPITLLELPLWKTLVRIASAAEGVDLIHMSGSLLLDLLFEYPKSADILPASIVPCQCEFVRSHIQDLCDTCESTLHLDEKLAEQKFSRGISLLSAMLGKSKETAARYAATTDTETLVLDDDQGSTALTFKAQVYGPDFHPKQFEVHAAADTKVSELRTKLPEKTLTSESRIIVGGREITLEPGQTLSGAQITDSGVVMIRPKYTPDLDLEDVLTRSGPVEEEIMSQYEKLESFLEGPDPIAQQAFDFLSRVRTSPQARNRVTSVSASAAELFPKDKPWRSRFSLMVLQSHLFEYARLGVMDKGFTSKAIQLLVSVMLDASRPLQPIVMVEVAKCLAVFFQNVTTSEVPVDNDFKEQDAEVSKERDDRTSLENGEPFVSRLIELLFSGLELPMDLDHLPMLSMRTSFVRALYLTLLESCRAQKTLWKSTSQHPDNVTLHQKLLLDDNYVLSREIAICVENLCRDPSTSDDVVLAYWHTLLPSLPQALLRASLSEAYFALLTNLFTQISLNEAQIRTLINSMLSELWIYRHTESTKLPVLDKAMYGLLRMLGLSVTYLKSYKKPLQMDGLPARLLRTLLHPHPNDPLGLPLVHEETRNLAYALVRSTYETHSDFQDLVEIAGELGRHAHRQVGFRFLGLLEEYRAPWLATGLYNLGMTCYMNSLLQQLFANLQFRKFLLDQPLSDHHRQQQDVLAHVQELFARMQNSTMPILTPDALANALGIQIGNQEDVHTFYTTLLSRLEEGMADDDAKRKLANCFTGKSITQIKGECGHVSSRTESFTELSITVKNKASLLESLDEFVQGEPLEGANKYMCMTCETHDGGRLVNAVRRTCMEDVPDNLTFCLKRFTYESMMEGENKVNDRFDFPRTIDMSLYKRSHLEDVDAPREPDIFELVGVIVHQGSLQFGHYWSYVRIPGSGNVDSAVWLLLEDVRVHCCDNGVRDVQNQCFGGPRWQNGTDRADSAYVLFYQRQSYMADVERLNIVPRNLQRQYRMLPAVEMHEEVVKQIDMDNKRRQFVASYFARGFHEFVIWLLGEYPAHHSRCRSSSPESIDFDEANPPEGMSLTRTETVLGGFVAQYTTRVLLADPAAEKKLETIIAALKTVFQTNPAIAASMLNAISDRDGFGFDNVVHHDNANVRTLFFAVVEFCLSSLQGLSGEYIATICHKLMRSHSAILGSALDDSKGRWGEYLAFAASVANTGSEQTCIILGERYLTWVLEIIFLRHDAEFRKKHAELHEWCRTHMLDLTPLFAFIHDLLKEHMDLSCDPSSLPDKRCHTARGWMLLAEEMGLLMRPRFVNRDHSTLLMLLSASRNCFKEVSKWQDYAPGKLVGLLVSDKAHLKIVRLVQDALLTFYDIEQDNLLAMAHMTLHYCLHHADDEDCRLQIDCLTRNMLQFNRGCEGDILMFYEEAFGLVPVAVVHSMQHWFFKYLQLKNAVRQKTVAFLENQVHAAPPLSHHPDLDALRIRTTRTLCHKLQETLNNAYSQEHRRGGYECLIQALQSSQRFLAQLPTAIAQAKEKGVELTRAILLEYDESRSVMTGVAQTLNMISEWEPEETTLPTRLHDEVQRSVEAGSDTAQHSDIDEDDEDYDEMPEEEELSSELDSGFPL